MAMATKNKGNSKSDATANTTARLSSTPARLLLVAAAAFGFSSVACGPLTPVSPTWKDDVRPLLVSRCIRCHDGQMRKDQSIAEPKFAPAAYNFDYPDLPSPLPTGLALLVGPVGLGSLDGTNVRRMPPPPNEALEEWQKEIIKTWATDPR